MPITFRPLHPLICPNLRMKRKYLLKIVWQVVYDFSSNRIAGEARPGADSAAKPQPKGKNPRTTD